MDTGAGLVSPAGQNGINGVGLYGAGTPKLNAKGPVGLAGAPPPGAMLWNMANMALFNAAGSVPGAEKAGYPELNPDSNPEYPDAPEKSDDSEAPPPRRPTAPAKIAESKAEETPSG
ncbi:hypothetical protein NDU88_006007 [Pleurodeles waltl]|uniref:Uncharacterized protein n=1 Tax=Pleurodeles waltl TaxID=8319 RepID=A0AAV7WEB8_PLEWA|nr:hypothetical protein NDU88_006007 [Pleurodeles waltl]